MKITFDQTDKTQLMTSSIYERTATTTKTAESKTTQAGCYTPAKAQDAPFFKKQEKGKSLLDIEQEAGQQDVGVTQDYMTLMSHTMSEEDYAKLEEEGFHFQEMEPEEAVTIVDKIKAELVRCGVQIEGYTDDLDTDTLTAALGNAGLAAAVVQSFAQSDISVQQDRLKGIATAWNMAQELQPLSDNAIHYMLDNRLESEIWNLYLAQNSGAGRGDGSLPNFAARDMEGYFAQKEAANNSELTEQIDRQIVQMGKEADADTRARAQWLLERGLPIDAENMNRLEELQNLTLPMTTEQFGKVIASAVLEGKSPVNGNVAEGLENIYEKANRLYDFYNSDEAYAVFGNNVTARRQLEEVRLHMTAEVNLKLIRSGFAIDTAPMEELIEALKEAEKSLANLYFDGASDAIDKYRTFVKTEKIVDEIPTLPIDTVYELQSKRDSFTLQEYHHEGKVLQETYTKASVNYESLMTAPRKDLGDSINKAFRNVDEILQDMQKDVSEDNRKVVRILGRNNMEINESNFTAVKDTLHKVQEVVERMTPAATLKMIRDGKNPLELSVDELRHYFDTAEQSADDTESYSKFLFKMEHSHQITEEERESYIGIYRMLRQLEKGDDAAIGAVVDTNAKLQFSSILRAIRTGKTGHMNRVIGKDEAESGISGHLENSISNQINTAFRAVSSILAGEENVDTDRAYRQQILAQYRESIANITEAEVDLLMQSESPIHAENLLAAKMLLSEESNIFAEKEDRKKVHKLIDDLDTPEIFAEDVTELLEEEMQLTAEEIEQTNQYIDVRNLQLRHKQLTVAAAAVKSEEYFIPMEIDGKMTQVHLTMKQSETDTPMVEIKVNTEEDGGIYAGFTFENGEITGFLAPIGNIDVMKLETVADNFIKEAGKRWNVGDVSIGYANIKSAKSGEGKDAITTNEELYQMAKRFLLALQKEE